MISLAISLRCFLENGALHRRAHGLRTTGEEFPFTEQPKMKSQSQSFRYGRSIFCLPHWPKFSDFFALFLHQVSAVRALEDTLTREISINQWNKCSCFVCTCKIEQKQMSELLVVKQTIRSSVFVQFCM